MISRRAALSIPLAAPVLGAASCLRAPPHEDPGPGWQVVETAHFRIFTDQSARVYEETAVGLEETYTALSETYFDGVRIEASEAIVLGEFDFEDVLGALGGAYVPAAGRGGVLAIREGAYGDYVRRIVAHELAHRFSARRYPRLPRFLNEGLASYLETVVVEKDRVLFGQVSRDRIDALGTGRITTVEALTAADRQEFHSARESSHYATSWALMHFLMHADGGAHREGADRLLALYDGRRPAPAPQQAFAAALPALPVAVIDQRLRGYAFALAHQRGVSMLGMPVARAVVSPPRLSPADRAYVKQMCQVMSRSRVARRR